MGGDRYRPGSHYVTCDRTGLKTRVEDIRREWTGALVRKDWWEPRHPQDFVRPRHRNEGGPAHPSRPDPRWQFTGALTTDTTADAAAGAFVLEVESTVRFNDGDSIGVYLDNKDQFRVVLQAVIDPTHLQLAQPLPEAASAGAHIIDYSAINEPNIG